MWKKYSIIKRNTFSSFCGEWIFGTRALLLSQRPEWSLLRIFNSMNICLNTGIYLDHIWDIMNFIWSRISAECNNEVNSKYLVKSIVCDRKLMGFIIRTQFWEQNICGMYRFRFSDNSFWSSPSNTISFNISKKLSQCIQMLISKR